MIFEHKAADKLDPDTKSQVVSNEEPPPYYAPTNLTSNASIDLLTGPSSNLPLRSTTPPPTPPDDPKFKTIPSNYISIISTHDSVTGTWTLDTSLVPPSIFLGPILSSPSPSSLSKEERERQLKEIEKEGTGMISANGRLMRPNLRLKSQYGGIDARARFVGARRGSEAGVVTCESQNGSIKFAVTFRGLQRLYLKLISTYGSISIKIPRDFVGLIHHRTTYGSLKLSDEVTAVATTFNVHQGTGRTFVGDWRKYDLGPGGSGGLGLGGVDGQGGQGAFTDLDTLVMESEYAKMSVSFVDE